MPQLRHDPIQKRWVIIATDRASRPQDYAFELQAKKPPGNGVCPLCPGHEGETPREIMAFRRDGSAPNTPGWDIRVVPNRYPALKIEGDLDRKGVGIYDVINGIGAHEVIVETPEHGLSMADYSEPHLAKVLVAYRERIRDLMRDARFRYILIFKNDGEAAGASLAHSHTQLIATPVTPRIPSLELEHAMEYFKVKERCLFCDIITQEREAKERVVAENRDFIALCPFASRFPYEIFLAPKQHSHDYTHLIEPQVSSLSSIFKEVLRRLQKALGDPAYNFVLHSAPNTETVPKRVSYWATLAYDFHWHFEIMPRITKVAGFEWGTGFYINPVPPEEAAKHLRELVL